MAKALKHYGILGMKWGFRKRRPDSSDYTTTKTLRKKSVREMSNDEIAKVIRRVSLEKQLKDLNSSQNARGQKILMGLLTRFGPQIVRSFVKSRTGFDVNDPFGSDNTSNVNILDLKFLKD